MTTIVIFSPSTTQAFSFGLTLDGQLYNAMVTWNVHGERYYLNIYDNYTQLILSRPLIGSPLNYDINLIKGYFTSTLVFRQPTQQFEISP